MKRFWNFKAKKYPKPFEDDVLLETKKVIEIIKNLGIDISNKRIIDIGCGTGIYGLIFAEMANEVLCLDFSNEMIKILKKEAIKRNITNISCIIKDFAEFDTYAYKKYFDISFASMTPAIKNENDIVKMENLSKKWCVYIGWAGRREDKTLKELYSIFKIRPHRFNGFYKIKNILDKRNIKYKTYIFKTSWKWQGSIEEAVEEFYQRLSLDCKDVNKERIKNFLINKFPNGEVLTKTFANEGIIVWQV